MSIDHLALNNVTGYTPVLAETRTHVCVYVHMYAYASTGKYICVQPHPVFNLNAVRNMPFCNTASGIHVHEAIPVWGVIGHHNQIMPHAFYPNSKVLVH